MIGESVQCETCRRSLKPRETIKYCDMCTVQKFDEETCYNVVHDCTMGPEPELARQGCLLTLPCICFLAFGMLYPAAYYIGTRRNYGSISMPDSYLGDQNP